MNFVLKPWQFALFVIAGWVSREQQQVIEYLLHKCQPGDQIVIMSKLLQKTILKTT